MTIKTVTGSTQPGARLSAEELALQQLEQDAARQQGEAAVPPPQAEPELVTAGVVEGATPTGDTTAAFAEGATTDLGDLDAQLNALTDLDNRIAQQGATPKDTPLTDDQEAVFARQSRVNPDNIDYFVDPSNQKTELEGASLESFQRVKQDYDKEISRRTDTLNKQIQATNKDIQNESDPAVRAQLEDQKANLMRARDQVKGQVKEEFANYYQAPTDFSDAEKTQELIDTREREMSELNNTRLKKASLSRAGRALTDLQQTIQEAGMYNTAMRPSSKTVEGSSFMHDQEVKTGIRDSGLISSVIARAATHSMIGVSKWQKGQAEDGTDAYDANSQDQSFEDMMADLESLAEAVEKGGNPADSRLAELPDFEVFAGLIGNQYKESLNRMGLDIEGNPQVEGENLTAFLIDAGMLNITSWTNPDTGVLHQKVWHNEAMLKDAMIGLLAINPAVLKLNPKLPKGFKQVGWEGPMKKAIKRYTDGISGGSKQKGLVSKDSVEAGIHTEQVRRRIEGPEATAFMHYLSLAEQYVADRGQTFGVDSPQYRAAEMLGCEDLSGTPNQQGKLPADQNLNRIKISANYMASQGLDAYTHRIKFGVPSSRMYPTVRLNPTYFKEIRGVERAASPVEVVPAAAEADGEHTRSTKALADYMAKYFKGTSKADGQLRDVFTDAGKRLPKGLKRMSFQLSIASVLSSDQDVKVDPAKAIQMFHDGSFQEAWQPVGQTLAIGLLSQGNPQASLMDLLAARKNNIQPDIQNVTPEVAEALDKVAKFANNDNFGYVISAAIDNYLYNEVAKYNSNPENANKPKLVLNAPAVVQYDMSSAGTTTIAKDNADVSLVKSAGLGIDYDENGDVVLETSIRKRYAGQSVSSMRDVYLDRYDNDPSMDAGVLHGLMRQTFESMMNDDQEGPKFIDKWGKTPIMVTSYAKDHRTHHNSVMALLRNPKYKNFLDSVRMNYSKASGGKIQPNEVDLKKVVDDLAAVHAQSLELFLGADALRSGMFIQNIGQLANIAGEALKLDLFGQTMIFGQDKVEMLGKQQTPGSKQLVPISNNGQKVFDPLGAKGAKNFEELQEGATDFSTKSFVSGGRRYYPTPGTATSLAILAALGHKRESMMLAGTINEIQRRAKGAYFGNFYDGISGDAASALMVWYQMNYEQPAKALFGEGTNTRAALNVARTDLEGKVFKKLNDAINNNKMIDLTYGDSTDPEAESLGGFGFYVDEMYRQYYQTEMNKKEQMQGGRGDSPRFRSKINESEVNKQKLRAQLIKILKSSGWQAPADAFLKIVNPNEPGFKRYAYVNNQERKVNPISPAAAKAAFEVWLNLESLNIGIGDAKRVRTEAYNDWLSTGLLKKPGGGKLTFGEFKDTLQHGAAAYATTK